MKQYLKYVWVQRNIDMYMCTHEYGDRRSSITTFTSFEAGALTAWNCLEYLARWLQESSPPPPFQSGDRKCVASRHFLMWVMGPKDRLDLLSCEAKALGTEPGYSLIPFAATQSVFSQASQLILTLVGRVHVFTSSSSAWLNASSWVPLSLNSCCSLQPQRFAQVWPPKGLLLSYANSLW